jgi:hypothetical protein
MAIGLGPFDFYLSTAVFQHMPSHEHALKALGVASSIVRADGVALIQFRVPVQGHRQAFQSSYTKNLARWCSTRSIDFFRMCETTGWEPIDFIGEHSGSGYVFAYLRCVGGP